MTSQSHVVPFIYCLKCKISLQHLSLCEREVVIVCDAVIENAFRGEPSCEGYFLWSFLCAMVLMSPWTGIDYDEKMFDD